MPYGLIERHSLHLIAPRASCFSDQIVNICQSSSQPIEEELESFHFQKALKIHSLFWQNVANGLSRHVVAFQHYYKAVKGRREYDGLLPDLGSIAEKRGGPFPLHTLLSST